MGQYKVIQDGLYRKRAGDAVELIDEQAASLVAAGKLAPIDRQLESSPVAEVVPAEADSIEDSIAEADTERTRSQRPARRRSED